MINIRFLVVNILFFVSILFGSNLHAEPHRGAVIYSRLCAQCHAPNGSGQENIGAPKIAGLPQWYVEAQLQKYKDGARGKHPADIVGMRMRPMANTLKTEQDLKGVSEYVSQMPSVSAAGSKSVGGRHLKGEIVYATCTACHGADGKGNEALKAPPIAGQAPWYLLSQLKHFKEGVRGWNAELDASGASMRAISLTLEEQAMKDVVSYVETLSP